MPRDRVSEERARRRLVELLAAPEPVAASLEGWCDEETVRRVGRCLLRRLQRPQRPVARVLDEVSRELDDGDEGLVVGFWARAEARRAGVLVPFDAEGLERLRSKA